MDQQKVQQLYEEGLVLKKHKHYADALSCFEQVVELDANHAEAWYRIGCCRSEIAKLDMEDCYDSHHLARDFHGVLGFYQATIDAFQKVIVLKADHTCAQNSLAALFYDLGVCGLKCGVGDHEDYYNCYEPVIESFNRATEVRPDCIDVYHRIGLAYSEWMNHRIWDIECAKAGEGFDITTDDIGYGVHDIAEARIKIYQRLIDIQSDDAEAYYELGKAYTSWISAQIALWEGQGFDEGDEIEEMKQGKHDFLKKAIEAYRTAIGIKPDYADAYRELAESCQWIRQFDEAIRAFKQAIVLGNMAYENLAETYHGLGKQNFAEENYTEAIECYHNAIVTDPKYNEVYRDLAVANDEEGNHELAVHWYERARSTRNNPNLEYRLAKAYHRLGRYQDAVETYQKAIDCQIAIEGEYNRKSYYERYDSEPPAGREWWTEVNQNLESASRNEPL